MSQRPPSPSRTDLILRALVATVEQNRASLDAAPDMTQVAVIVNFDERSGLPRRTVLRPEVSWNLRPSVARDVPGGEDR